MKIQDKRQPTISYNFLNRDLFYKKCFSVLIFLILWNGAYGSDVTDKVKVTFSEQSTVIKKGSEYTLHVNIRGEINGPATLQFTAEQEGLVQITPCHIDLVPGMDGGDHNFSLVATRAGRTTVYTNTSSDELEVSRAFVLVNIHQQQWLEILSVIVGWAYFLCWSVCFYPQVYQNFNKKSVVGFSFDFVAISMTGFVSYSIFNSCLFWVPSVQTMYYELHPRGVIPVTMNDWLFAIHAVFITSVIIIQCLIYERGDQRVSVVCRIFLGTVYAALTVALILACVNVFSFLQYLYLFSYVKVLMTLIQYTPQAYLNYQRKSSEGLSIGFIWLDVFGGIFSMTQMFVIAYNYEDWSAISGYLAKLGLSILTLSFDMLFLVQHYCLYVNARHKPVPTEELHPAKEFWTAKPGSDPQLQWNGANEGKKGKNGNSNLLV